MNVAVLGGLGMQGRAALADLVRFDPQENVTVVCADAYIGAWSAAARGLDPERVRPVRLDATSPAAVRDLLEQGVDVAVDLLPLPLMANAFEAAVAAGVHLVSTNYGGPIRHMDAAARSAGITLMPECGLDPGIDLVICGHAVRRFDEVHVFNSYCGGFPAPEACDNPLNYKISWNWDMVLRAQKRDSVFIRDGRRLHVPAADQHDSEMIHRIDFPGIGALEAVPNGDAVFYTDLLGITATVQQAGRYALRWPGWCDFWRPLKKFGFLSDTPLAGVPGAVSPHQFTAALMAPQLQYKDHERDLVAMVNHFEGLKDGRKQVVRNFLSIERDPGSGLMAMSRGVGCTAAIVARMIGRGQITATGVRNPAVDVPYAPLAAELDRRGITIVEEVTGEDEAVADG
jgi:lysine 6-dehydrogenase